MPIEIRELVIRATVSPPTGQPSSGSGNEQQAGVNTQELMTQIADMLRKKKER